MHIVPAASNESSGAPKTSGTPGSTGPRASARFGAIFKRKLDTPKVTSDAAAQIAALLQQGVPLMTVVDRIATQLADATARSFSKPLDADANATLKRAYASALAPPGASPPSTIAEQASALRERLRNLLGTLVGGAKDAGQQSRFSGMILDATAAKDNPAPQPKLPIPTPSRTISSIIESLVQHAAVKTQPSVPAPAQAPTNLLERVIARAVRADGGVASSHPIAPANAEKLFNRLIGIIFAAKADDAGKQDA
ncbi:MAG: hypothetical protein M3R35_04270, partial [Candidatus Eremiobacteraeota bacterium]|nr:hypothetical protein [Candidatus Eremiobacteraeota bacterium]